MFRVSIVLQFCVLYFGSCIVCGKTRRQNDPLYVDRDANSYSLTDVCGHQPTEKVALHKNFCQALFIA